VPFRFFLTASIQLNFFLVYDLTPAERVAAVQGLSELLATGKIKHAIGARFKLQEIAAAHEAVEQGKLIGNVVIDCQP
jgi:NADPH2:quinone reductase